MRVYSILSAAPRAGVGGGGACTLGDESSADIIQYKGGKGGLGEDVLKRNPQFWTRKEREKCRIAVL